MRMISFALAFCVFASCSRPGDAAKPPAGAVVRVDGRLMTVNGQTEIPRGLFGVHAVKVTPESVEDLGIDCFRQIHFLPGSGSVAIGKDGKVNERFKNMPVVIDCQGDRYCPATVLTNPNYEQYFRNLGRQYAQRCKDAAWRGYVEFWNEPYLNWASRSHGAGRNHYNNRFYDVSKAAEDGPVTIKGWDKPLEHLRWKRIWARGEDGNIGWGVKVPEGAKPGDTFRSRNTWYWTNNQEQTFTVIEEWHIHDPTQVEWWSGRQNLDFYLWMFLPFAKAVKETNPEVQVIAGWDFGLTHGDWAVWRELCVPLLDAGIQWIDGITEHHYGIDTREVPAWYEVAVAHTMSRHGKWIRGFNTECGGSLDPAVHGMDALKGAQRAALEKDAAAATYALRDILELAYHCPAKVGSRTAHGFGMESGVAQVLRFLKDLRGSLVWTDSNDLDLWPVASINGQRLVVVVFNNAEVDKEITFTVAAPQGTTLRDGRVAWIEADAAAGRLRIGGEPLKASGRELAIRRSLGSRQAVKFVLPLAGRPPHDPQVERRQFFAREGVLHKVKPGQGLKLHVAIDRSLLARTQKARLKLVLEGVGGGEANVTVNGTLVAIPDRQWTMELPLDPSVLKDANELVFTCEGDEADGYQVDAASLVVEAPIR